MTTATPAMLVHADALARLASLTAREREVLVLSSKGLTLKEVASCLRVACGTINDHRKNIYRKLDVNSAVEAAVIAAKAGLV